MPWATFEERAFRRTGDLLTGQDPTLSPHNCLSMSAEPPVLGRKPLEAQTTRPLPSFAERTLNSARYVAQGGRDPNASHPASKKETRPVNPITES